MRTVRIFALPSHVTKERNSGVDFARVIQPMKHLHGKEFDNIRYEVEIYDPTVEEIHSDPNEWTEIVKRVDIIYFNYIHNPWGFAAMGAMARGHGVKLVMDLDDSLWNIKSDNPAYTAYHKGSKALHDFTSICNEVDLMVTTSEYLKHVIMNNTRKKAWEIKVIPNYIDLELYNHKPAFKNDGRIQLTHFGSTTHFRDLVDEEFAKGVDRIMKEYPNVSIKFVGALIPKYKERWGARYSVAFGHQDIYKWISGRFREFMDETDIMVVPLTDDIYNRCKSSIKYLEASSAGKPGIWQRIRQYEEAIDDGSTGFLATKSQEWYQALKKLIDDADLRRQVGENAYQDVKENWTIDDHVKAYHDILKPLLT